MNAFYRALYANPQGLIERERVALEEHAGLRHEALIDDAGREPEQVFRRFAQRLGRANDRDTRQLFTRAVNEAAVSLLRQIVPGTEIDEAVLAIQKTYAGTLFPNPAARAHHLRSTFRDERLAPFYRTLVADVIQGDPEDLLRANLGLRDEEELLNYIVEDVLLARFGPSNPSYEELAESLQRGSSAASVRHVVKFVTDGLYDHLGWQTETGAPRIRDYRVRSDSQRVHEAIAELLFDLLGGPLRDQVIEALQIASGRFGNRLERLLEHDLRYLREDVYGPDPSDDPSPSAEGTSEAGRRQNREKTFRDLRHFFAALLDVLHDLDRGAGWDGLARRLDDPDEGDVLALIGEVRDRLVDAGSLREASPLRSDVEAMATVEGEELPLDRLFPTHTSRQRGYDALRDQVRRDSAAATLVRDRFEQFLLTDQRLYSLTMRQEERILDLSSLDHADLDRYLGSHRTWVERSLAEGRLIQPDAPDTLLSPPIPWLFYRALGWQISDGAAEHDLEGLDPFVERAFRSRDQRAQALHAVLGDLQSDPDGQARLRTLVAGALLESRWRRPDLAPRDERGLIDEFAADLVPVDELVGHRRASRDRFETYVLGDEPAPAQTSEDIGPYTTMRTWLNLALGWREFEPVHDDFFVPFELRSEVYSRTRRVLECLESDPYRDTIDFGSTRDQILDELGEREDGGDEERQARALWFAAIEPLIQQFPDLEDPPLQDQTQSGDAVSALTRALLVLDG